MVDLGEDVPAVRTFSAYTSTVTLHANRVEIRRSALAHLAGNTDTVIALADILQVRWRDPSRLLNGCLFLATAEDARTVLTIAAQSERTIGGNPHAIVLTWRQRETYEELKGELERVLPDVPMAPIG